MIIGINTVNDLPLQGSGFIMPIDFLGSPVFPLKVIGRPGLHFMAQNSANVFYEGSFNEDGPWTDLTDGLDLSGYDGIPVIVYIKATTDKSSGPESQETKLFLRYL